MRVKSEIWVRAYLRRCQAEGVPAVVARRGDEAAGAIFICVDRLDGTVTLYGPAPAGAEGSETERRWVSCLSSEPASNAEASAYLARQSRFDSDLWVIEIEDKHGRHFLGDDAIEE
ncbi:MAG TPA: DUF1491 family protein [Methyloceanibacter sp.]|jgi:hypothetical protein|nr:DUF1491 family protein [Methyloceanibacter sp.]